MAKKYYVVWAGRETGIFTSWDYTKKQVDKFPQAKYKSFATEAEAKAAFAKAPSYSSAAKKPSTSKTAAKASLDIDLSRCDVSIFTDGGCEPNPGKAGSGVAVYINAKLAELYYGLYNPNGTNNSAELNALHQALLIAEKALKQGQTVQILSDSQYSLNCITNWAYGWKAKGWKRKVAGDIKNLDIIQQSHALYDAIKDKLAIQHVAAHVGIEGNELADRMSIYAIDQQNSAFCRYPEPIVLSDILSLRAG
ncbi:ribonuclease H family protein [Shewanella fidelis]|uniref:Ribonuclease H n=1 Tax=Shewanella fidelis TaxID=173509 RepID=A0AAW8NJ27_9GAMM|nr:ribonuclease H family protein [Shewanella fidelis]MDR8523198.1 ribonuclease H family protein [Shewanella fidelis]MDW4811476.1 ribonuclease H family protein [Shewanella fidelis]MDW4815597.1 ribonuclease H family protein [Shewanella fidelis]MDW4819687.1 ribonuclease H family protein [Shewanella fidelis]MDW4824339.1 ribonuclease H family protein [Shewanella fidelis]